MRLNLALVLLGLTLLPLVGSAQSPAPQPPAPAPAPASSPVVPDTSSSQVDGSTGDAMIAGKWVRNKALNEIFLILASEAGFSYFSNPALNEMRVTGHLLSDNPREQMEELAIMYGVTLYVKGRTYYALNAEQIGNLPQKTLIRQLTYLQVSGYGADSTPTYATSEGSSGEGTGAPVTVARATPVESPERRISELLDPILSPKGKVRFEPKTNTIMVIDNEYSLAKVSEALNRLDRPQKQVVITVKIIKVNQDAAKRLGADWSNTLGAAGLNLGVTVVGRTGQIFNDAPFISTASQVADIIGASTAAATGATGTTTDTVTGTDGNTVTATSTSTFSGEGVILSPAEISVVLRALFETNIATQQAEPKIVVEDNDQALLRLIQRVPIVTQTVSQENGVNNISSQVRYRIDETDPIDPANAREVGVSIAVKPTILADGTIRMRLLPRVATITGYRDAPTGIAGIVNSYPFVDEVTASTLATVPNGYSLMLGSYYNIEEKTVNNKVPFLGDIPGLGFAFSSKQNQKIRSGLIFILTPYTYDARNPVQTVEVTERGIQQAQVPTTSKYPDPQNPGEDAEPNLAQRIRNLWPIKSKEKTTVSNNPLVENPNAPLPVIRTPQEVQEEKIKRQINQRAVSEATQ